MIKMKKLLAMSVVLIMTTSLLSGCSYDGLALINAFGKTQSINSMETKTDISVKVSGSNMSEMEEQMMSTVLPTINGTKMSIVTKTNQNSEKTISKAQSDISVQLGQIPETIDMSFWVDTDMTKDKPVINQVYKIPELLAAQLPMELQGKDYMVMNLGEMSSTPDMPQVNYDKLMTFSKEFQPKFLDFIIKYAKQFNPTTDYIKSVGNQNYEVKLTDKSFKDLMHYTLTNLSENTDAINFVRDIMTSVISTYDMTDAEAKSVQDEMNKAFENLSTELPEQLASLNKALDSIDDLKILGDNGIKIMYTVNQDGYIINEKGSVEFVIDLPGIIKLAGNSETVSSPSDPTGIYTIGIDFNTDTTNINGDVDIVMPKVNSINSFNYTDILNMITIPGVGSETVFTTLAGTDKYQTSIKIAQEGWTTSENVIIARGDVLADALAAAPLAYAKEAPILLTGTDKIPTGVLEQLKKMKVKKVYIVGGTGAVSKAVADKFDVDFVVERIEGKTRVETSFNIAKKAFSVAPKGVVIVNGYSYIDAISVSSIAAKQGMPILLVNNNKLSTDVSSYIKGKTVYAVGGTGVLSNEVIGSAIRLSGNNRYDTNAAILKEFKQDYSNVYLAKGTDKNMVDALSGSVLAAKGNNPIVLVDGKNAINNNQETVVKTNITANSAIFTFGGTVSDVAVNAIDELRP